MTEEQYWDKDCCLVKFYREADEIRKERISQEAWLQGAYIYDALIRVSPIFHPFAKKGTKPQDYVEEPYPITQKAMAEAQDRKKRTAARKGLQYMQAYMVENNKRFKTEVSEKTE